MKISQWFPHKNGSVKGGVDGIARGILFGWAVDRTNPDKPLELEILVGDILVGKAIADLPRPDIGHAVTVGGRCGFTFNLQPFFGKSLATRVVVRAASTGRQLSGSPIEVTENAGWGALDGINGIVVNGWAVMASPAHQFPMVEIFVDGHPVGRAPANIERPDLRLAGLAESQCGFKFTLPGYLFDDEKHAVTARIADNGTPLRGEKSFHAVIKSYMDHCSLDRVSGWALNVYAQDVPLTLDLYVDEKLITTTETSYPRRDVVSNLGLKGETASIGFDIALPQSRQDWTTRRLRLCVADTDYPVGGEEHVFFRNDFVIRILEDTAASLLHQPESDRCDPGKELALVRQYLFPHLTDQFRQGPPFTHITAKLTGSLRSAYEAKPGESEPVDVIIPVYKGYQETLDCIQSVLRSRTENNFELIVINDHGPDVTLTATLRDLASKSQFTLIENKKNMGFVATVNIGMKLHSHRDVVLLNSDTVVPKAWLEGLRRAAYSSPGIGTVTPFSNRATICSLPRTCFDNEMPLGLSVEELNTVCARANPDVTVDIPTAIGFAMYIRRETLNEVGYFDEEKWDKGYGEENDFCIRATARGWRHVAACDVFVQHHGSVSFDTEKSPRVQKNLAKLNKLYPDYPGKIQRFIKADPLAVARGRVNAELMKRLAQRYVLFVTHGMGGGTEKAIGDLCELHAKDGKSVLILRSNPAGKLELSPAIAKYENTLKTEYPYGTSAALLAEQLQGLSIESVQFHHTLGFGADIWQLPEMLKVPYEVMIHDFYLVCPRINLIDDTGMYCGQPDIAVCERCVKANALDYDVDERLEEVGGTVARWRDFHAVQLCGARRVLAPSEDAKRRVQHYLPTQTIQAVSHPEPEFVFTQRKWDGSLPYRVAVLGAIGPHKGVNLLLACAKYAERRGLPIKFVVIGYTSCDEAFAKLSNVEITGRYKPEELEGILKRTGCIVALFLSLWPETFSYTLSEAWRSGLHPIALDIGAQADRIRERAVGTLLPFTQDPQIILTKLLSVLDHQHPMYSEAITSALSVHDHEHQ